jgi:hypothetical protein
MRGLIVYTIGKVGCMIERSYLQEGWGRSGIFT